MINPTLVTVNVMNIFTGSHRDQRSDLQKRYNPLASFVIPIDGVPSQIYQLLRIHHTHTELYAFTVSKLH